MEADTSTCLVCNRTFPVPTSTQDFKHILHNVEILTRVEDCFAKNFGFSPEEITRVSFLNKPKSYPFCSKCTPMTKNLLKLQTALTDLEKKLTIARRELATIMVNTYVHTKDESPFFPMKNLIFEKWHHQIDRYSVEKEMANVLKTVKEQQAVASTEPTSLEKQSSGVSREVALLKRKGKGDKMPISIDEEEVEEITCSVCNKICRSKEHLTLHIKTHTGATRPFECNFCGKSFFNPSTFKTHLKMKHDYISPDGIHVEVEETRPMSIKTEMAKVTMEGGQEAHLIIGRAVEAETETPPPELEDETLCNMEVDQQHEQCGQDETTHPIIFENSEKCEHCGKCFANKVTLAKHNRTVHLKTVQVECPICSMKTRDHFNLAKHVLSHDPKLTKLTYNCPLCGDGFIARKDLIHHYKRNHGAEIIGKGYPKPIIRVLAEHEEVSILQDCKEGSSAAISESVHVPSNNDDDSTENPLPSIVAPPPPLLHQTSSSVLACAQQLVETAQFPEVTNGLSSEEVASLEKSSFVKPRLRVSLKKGKKRRRRAMLTYMPRTKLLRLRQQRLEVDINSPLRTESGVMSTSKLISGAGVNLISACTDSLESDETLVKEAQTSQVALQQLNFNLILRIEKLQTVMLSPERDDEDDILFPKAIINGVLQNAEPGQATSSGSYCSKTNESNHPKIKIYGPKSKLDEIRSRKLKFLELNSSLSVGNPVLQNSPGVSVPSNSIPRIKITITNPLKRNAKISPQADRTIEKAMDKLFKEDADRIAGTPVPSGGQAEVGSKFGETKNLEAQLLNRMKPYPWTTNTSTPAEKSRREVWVNNSNARKSLNSKAWPQPPASLSLDGKTLILKRVSGPASASPIVTTALATNSSNSVNTRPSNPNSTILQVAPPNRTGYWADPSRILQSPKDPTSSTYLLGSKNALPPAKYPLPNKHLAQIAKSFKKRPRIQPVTSVVPHAKHKVYGMARQLIKSGITNPNVVPFGRNPANTAGPIIQSTHSLASQAVRIQLNGSETVDILPQPVPQRSPPVTKTPRISSHLQLQALLRNANIDVSLVRPEETNDTSSDSPAASISTLSGQSSKGKFPADIRLIQVEDVLKGKTPAHKEGIVLSPSPKRRFVLPGNRDGKNKILLGTASPKPVTAVAGTTSNVQIASTSASASSSHIEYEPDAGPIRIRSMDALRDLDVEMEEVEVYEPNLDQPRPAEQAVRPAMPGNGALRKLSAVTTTRQLPPQFLPKTAAYRPFPLNETRKVMRYTEHIQQMRMNQQTIPVQQFQPVTMSPVRTSNILYIPAQPQSNTSFGQPSTSTSNAPALFWSSLLLEQCNPKP